jgi:ligand-binding sensor domain-containing protein
MEGRYFYALASDGGSRIALGTDRGLSYSGDSGKSWINVYVSYGLSSVLFDDSGTLWGVSRNGIWRFVPPEMEPETVRIAGYSWSPTVYFTRLLSGEEGSLLGLLNKDIVRLLPTGGSAFSLEKSSLGNAEILSHQLLSQGGMLLGTPRGFYFSEDGGVAWQEGHVPRNLFNRSEGR